MEGSRIIDTFIHICPYRADRIARGLDVEAALGPDLPDLFPSHSMSSASGVQAKRQGFASSLKKKVQFGLPPATHSMLAEAVASPLDFPASLLDDLDFACPQMVMFGDRFARWQRGQFRTFGNATSKLTDLAEFFRSRRSSSAIVAYPSVQPHFLDAASRIMRWPDVSLPWLATVGVPIVGPIPPVGMYRGAETDPTEHGFEVPNELWVAEVQAMPPPKKEHFDDVWEKCRKEQELGLLGPWLSSSQLDAKYGVGGWRAIDNGKSSGQTDAGDLSERIHTTSADMDLAVAQIRLRLQVVAGPPRALHRSTRDMNNAFRQISCADIHARFHIVAAYHPLVKKWVFAELTGLAFGIGVAVHHF